MTESTSFNDLYRDLWQKCSSYRNYTRNHVQSTVLNQEKDFLHDFDSLNMFTDPVLRAQLRERIERHLVMMNVWRDDYLELVTAAEALMQRFEAFDNVQQWAEDLEPMDND